jgi:uncharacterized protein YggE
MNEQQNHIHIEPPHMVVIAVTGTLAILALFLFAQLVQTVGNFGRHESAAQNTITVTGTGKATAVPDIATISYSVTESGTTVALAQAAATTKSNAALAAVKALGIDEKDIKTDSYNVTPKYDTGTCAPGVYCPQNTNKIIGYEVTQSTEVKVRDTAKAGDVLQKLGSLNVQNISGPNFALDDSTATHDQARAAAIADARAKAATLASQLGVHLGDVVSFSENGSGPTPMYAQSSGAMMDKAAAVAPTLSTGQNETDVNVSLVYEIR